MAGTNSFVAFVCGYAEDKTGGVFSYEFHPGDGHLDQLHRTESEAVMFLAFSPDMTHLYTVNQVSDGVVTAYRIDDSEGSLTEVNRQSTEGTSPCFISVDLTGQYAFVANYGGGTVSMFPIEGDGRIGSASHVVDHSELPVAQEEDRIAHPHSIAPGPNNRFAYAPDLGLDRIMIYRIDIEKGRLRPADTPSVSVDEGTGPRHFEFHPNDHYLYVINERNSSITSFEWDPDTGALNIIETVSTVPDDFDEETYCADIHFHPSGRFLYGSNRGHDSIAIFEVDEETGELETVGHESTRGHWPRNFAIDPSGDYLYVENRRSNSIVPLEIDDNTGQLTVIDTRLEIPEPLCMRFATFE